jgi:APA family basic amino acid/polyamine antiporter
MTFLKIAPLLAISGLGLVAGHAGNLPAFNPTGAAILPALAATALLTMWAFTGLEAGAAPAANVKDAERTIPRAIIIGTLSVTLIYLSSTMAVMLLVPAETLVNSSSPFADAARGFGAWGPLLVGAGALVATAGSLNGIIFVAGQMPMAVALDKLAPTFLARTNKGGAPQLSLLLASVLGSLLLMANYSRGAISAFTFLLMMSTVTVLLPYLFSAAAELRYSWRSARGWAAIALLAGGYSLFAIIGSGTEVMGWGLVLMLVGAPVFYLGRQGRRTARAPETA